MLPYNQNSLMNLMVICVLLIVYFEEHGQFGKFILSKNSDELLREFLQDNDSCDYILREIVGEYTSISNEKYKLQLESLINIFLKYD